MRDETLFISDCHVDASKPEITSNLLDFLQNRAKHARFLYILGDLFEAWIGDDEHNPGNEPIVDCLKVLSKNTKIYFLAGNRDFLLGNEAANAIGLTRIDDPTLIQLGDHRVALLHGDTLCTDDDDYQAFRRIVRDPHWQAQFLLKPLAERKAISAAVRLKSSEAMAEKAVEIMDVNDAAVSSCFTELEVDVIIHGHTHRPAVHPYANNQRRFVLGDWNPQPSYLSWNSTQGFKLVDSRVSES
ncbi:MAG: UDP-2,3-diacylglucosamine hydrolase [Gammaproteobacteria bacterium]|jgi:UDP-2,3-diacylglucosamine hydrolase